jgi:putative transposase
LKGFTAREINCLLQRTHSQLWQRESYDHWLREGEFDRIKRYIELNPVKAGLAREASAYPWSSARSTTAGPTS